jgi:hypothetical protein
VKEPLLVFLAVLVFLALVAVLVGVVLTAAAAPGDRAGIVVQVAGVFTALAALGLEPGALVAALDVRGSAATATSSPPPASPTP